MSAPAAGETVSPPTDQAGMDVLAYKAARAEGRLAFLDVLAAESAQTGEADMTLDDYADAINSTRHSGR